MELSHESPEDHSSVAAIAVYSSFFRGGGVGDDSNTRSLSEGRQRGVSLNSVGDLATLE